MIESFKDMKRPSKDSIHDILHLEHTTSQILHLLENKSKESELATLQCRILSNALTVYGCTRHLDIITSSPTSSRHYTASIVEHNPTSRPYIHCTSAREHSRVKALEHLLVITEDLLARLMDSQGITSAGWLPGTPAAQQAAHREVVKEEREAQNAAALRTAIHNSVAGSVAGTVTPGSSIAGSRRSSVQLESNGSSGSSLHHFDAFAKPSYAIARSNSDMFHRSAQQWPNGEMNPHMQAAVPRTNSETLQAPKPLPVGRLPGQGKVQWNLGSEG